MFKFFAESSLPNPKFLHRKKVFKYVKIIINYLEKVQYNVYVIMMAFLIF